MQQAGVRLVVNGMELDVADDANVLLTRAIDNISKPGERQAGFSTTIKLPGTPNNHRVFGHIYDLQVDEARIVPYSQGAYLDDTGQPQLIAYVPSRNNQCEVQVDGLPIFRGVLRLEKIVQQPRKVVEYEVRVELAGAAWVEVFKNTDLTDLPDWQAEDVYENGGIFETKDYDGSNPVLHKYLYPLVDYGNLTAHINNGAASPAMPMQELRPAVFARTLLHSCFRNAGYQIGQDDLNNAKLRGLLLPLTGEWVTPRPFNSVIEEEYFVEDAGPFNQWVGEDILFSDDFSDWFPPYTGLRFFIEFTNTGSLDVSFGLTITTPTSKTLFDENYTFSPGEKINLIVEGTGDNEYRFDVELPLPATIGQRLTAIINYEGNRAVEAISGKNRFLQNSVLPQGLSCIDFVQALTRLFNLYIDVNESTKIVNIYTRNNYLLPSSLTLFDVIDWTEKVDENQQIEQEFTVRELPRAITYLYDNAGDIFGDFFENNYDITYGSLRVDNGTAALAEEAEQSIGFASASTETITYDNANRAISVIRLTDSAVLPVQSKFSWNPYFAQLHRHSGQSIIINNFANIAPVTVSYANAPCAVFAPGNTGDTPAPQTLTFGDSSGQLGLYNAFYAEQIQQLRFSRKLRMAFALTPADFFRLDFRKPIRLDNQNYYLQLVDQFDARGIQTTTVELVKLVSVIESESTPPQLLGSFNSDFNSDFKVF